MRKFAVLLILVLAVTGSAQEEQSGVIKSAKGVLVVWNEPGNYYTLEIKGSRILPAEQPKLFQVDGKFFQIQTTEKAQFVQKLKGGTTSDDKAILAAHRDWERDYASGLLKNELKVESEWVKLPNGQDALAWSFKMPKLTPDQKVKKQMFLTAIKRDHVFVLNSALEDNDEEQRTRTLLLETMSTLRTRDKPLSLQKASEQVRKEN